MKLSTLKTSFQWVLLACLLLLQYQNCSSYNDPSLFQMNNSSSTAATSNPADTKLDSPTGVLDVAETDMNISFGGQCNVGLSTKHYIEVHLSDSSNLPIAVRQDGLCPANAANLPADCYVNTQFLCEHGRYYVLLPLNCSAYRGMPQSIYRVTGQLVTVDSTGKETRDTKASFDRFFQVSWAQGACN